MQDLSGSIRRKFINYFIQAGHAEVASSCVVPHEDPTLLFINAGMNQFKDVFLGKTSRDYTRAVTCQKCIRGGGKHNDLENVGHTSRHLTFFEMLGNFSFGDYFKEKAIQYAWEVSTQVFGFDKEKIWATVFREDDEAYVLWQKYLPKERIVHMDEADNFWAMGDTGPCGPCSELLYDRGPEFGNATSPKNDKTGERFLEFWNLVFMQYNRNSDGTFEPLPKQSVDTGAGLERVVSLIMGVNSNFATDILRSLIKGVEDLSGIPYEGEDSPLAPAFHVIADHIRSLAFAIADGVQPSNVDRGYVLRKILRRAVRYGRQLKFEGPFLAKLLPILINSMQDTYGELKTAQSRIAEILTLEEEAFFRTLKRGGNLLNQVIAEAKTKSNQISGEDAFKLKDTYGLPLEEITLIATDNYLTIDLDRFKTLEKEAKERSKSAHKKSAHTLSENIFTSLPPSQFEGYTQDLLEATLIGIVVDGAFVQQLSAGQEALILLDKTPFYAEKGGQVGDTGTITKEGTLFEVDDCQSPFPNVITHSGTLQEGLLKVGDKILASIDVSRRKKIQNNHTATHLLHWALQEVIGEHIRQAGSVVDDSRLRFDFSHHKALTDKDIACIEDLVNSKIRSNMKVETYELSYADAQKRKEIKQFFGDKYGSKVRVVDINFSKELCGGTHTESAGNIGYFRVTKESSIAAGVRRIEAVTGYEAEQFARENVAQLQHKISEVLEEKKKVEEELKRAKKAGLVSIAKELISRQESVGKTVLIQAEVDTPDLKELADAVMGMLPSGVLVLGSKDAEKCSIMIRVSSNLTGKVNAGALVKEIAPIIEGSGGGRPDAAQAGGKAPENLQKAFDHIRKSL